jgi:hypothetical protein
MSENYISRDLEWIQSFVVDGGDPETYGQPPTEQALRRIIFRKNNSRSAAFVLALAKRQPKNITNGAPIDTTEALSVYNKKQFHHIYPEAYLKRTLPDVERGYLINYCLLAAAENAKISDSDPNIYLPELARGLGEHADEAFASNLLPAPSEFDYGSASLEEFIDARLSLVAEEMRVLCSGGM